MLKIQQITEYLNQFAPTRLAEEWDNVGLLVGDPAGTVSRVMTCLTITPESAAEAIARGAELIVAHHPLPFKPIKKLTTQQTSTKLLWDLIRAGVSIYSPHTSFDSAKAGINQSLAERLELNDIQPLVPMIDDVDGLGAGRFGRRMSETLEQLIDKIKTQFDLQHLQYVGQLSAPITKIAVACGSGGTFLVAAKRLGCDCFVTGETNFHNCLEAESQGIALVLLGHYASERFALESLAARLQSEFRGLEVWASARESDPVKWS